jgi:methionyl-tRNA synthetase
MPTHSPVVCESAQVEQSADKRGIDPQTLADENSAYFKTAMEKYNISFDDFIRTTELRHTTQVQAFLQRLLDADLVYLGEFEGWYDEGQEEYHTETKAAELEFVSPISGKPLVRAREKNYYFRLSSFQVRLSLFPGVSRGYPLRACAAARPPPP